MGQHKYFVSHQGQQLGPYSVDEIVGLVSQGTLSVLDYVWDQEKEDWILFMEHPEVSGRVREMKPKAPPKIASEPIQHEITKKSKSEPHVNVEPKEGQHIEWFVLKGENKFGPYNYIELVKMLQQGVAFEFDFAWHEGMDGWSRIAEIQEFSRESIKKLRDSSNVEASQIFFRRRHKRVKYGGTILVHDNKKVWKGQAVEISEGGAGVVMENSMVVPGQVLYLHFKPGDGVPPFNAICEVVSKQYVFGVRDSAAPVKYGLKFKDLSNEMQKALHAFSKNGAAA